MRDSISMVASGLRAITMLLALGSITLTGLVDGPVLANGGGNMTNMADIEIAHVTVDTGHALRTIPPNLFSAGKYTPDPVLQKWAKEAGFALIRVDVLLDAVEPVNDDDDPHHFNWAGFQWGDNAAQYGANLDDVVRQMVANGHKPLFILHRTQPWNGDGTWQSVPRDLEEWAEAAAATVYHFNKELGYGIQYWEIWNEPDVGGEFHGSLSQYLEMARVAARRMKEVDPTIKMGGPVWSHANLSIMRQVIQQAWDVFDFYSWHAYGTGGDESERMSDAQILAEVESKYGRFARSLRQMIERYDRSGRPKEIAITEFNIDWAETERGKARRQSMLNVVWTASVINHLLRGGVDITGIFSLTELGILGDGIHPQPVYYLYPLFRQHFGEVLLAAEATGPATLPGGKPDIEVMATSGKGRIQIWLINKAMVARRVEVEVRGPSGPDDPGGQGGARYVEQQTPPAAAEIWQLAGAPPPRRLPALPVTGDSVEITVPGYSVTVLELPSINRHSPVKARLVTPPQLVVGLADEVRLEVTNGSSAPVRLDRRPALTAPEGWQAEPVASPGSGSALEDQADRLGDELTIAPGETKVWSWTVVAPGEARDSPVVLWANVSGQSTASSWTTGVNALVTPITPVLVTAVEPVVRLDRMIARRQADGEIAPLGFTLSSLLHRSLTVEVTASWLPRPVRQELAPHAVWNLQLPFPGVDATGTGTVNVNSPGAVVLPEPPLLTVSIGGQTFYRSPLPVCFVLGVAERDLDLQDLFTNDGVSWDTDPGDGDLVDFPATLPAEELPAAGACWSAIVDGVLVRFRAPQWTDGMLNNVECYGQRVELPAGSYRAAFMWGALVGGDAKRSETFGLVYDDDSADEVPITVTVPGWWSADTSPAGWVTTHTHVRLPQVDPQSGRSATIAAVRVPVDSARRLVAIRLPQDPSYHVFAVTLQE